MILDVFKEENDRLDGLMVGIVFTLASLLLTLTFFIPIIAVFPGVLVESLAKNLVDNHPYSNVGEMTIKLLVIILVVALLITALKIRHAVARREKISKTKIAFVMLGFSFIVHPLGFYIYWAAVLDYRGDGQLIFAAVSSFPKSSWAFIPLGLMIDLTKNFDRR